MDNCVLIFLNCFSITGKEKRVSGRPNKLKKKPDFKVAYLTLVSIVHSTWWDFNWLCLLVYCRWIRCLNFQICLVNMRANEKSVLRKDHRGVLEHCIVCLIPFHSAFKRRKCELSDNFHWEHYRVLSGGMEVHMQTVHQINLCHTYNNSCMQIFVTMNLKKCLPPATFWPSLMAARMKSKGRF